MAGRSFTRHSNGIGNRIRAEHINELQSALEEDDARIDLKADDGQFTAHVDDTDNPHGVTAAQVGLGNVDNTSDADKPVSTAQQAALDGKADVEDAVPAGGVYGQVLTITHSGREWVDPPGIVYPSLLLSPDGSFDRNGPVSPVVDSGVSVVAGQYGQAWSFPGTTGTNVTLHTAVSGVQGAAVFRFRLSSADDILYLWGIGNYQTDDWIAFSHTLGGVTRFSARSAPGNQRNVTLGQAALGVTYAVYVEWTPTHIRAYSTGLGAGETIRDPLTGLSPGRVLLGNSGVGAGGSTPFRGEIESMVLYPSPLPTAERNRLLGMPTAWTPANTAVNMALQSQPPAGSPLTSVWPPNKTIATGGATLRTAPGASTQAIATLAASSRVHDTGQRITSTLVYAYVITDAGMGYVPATALV